MTQAGGFIFRMVQGGGGTPAFLQSGYGEAFPETVGTVGFGVPGIAGEDVTAGSLLVLSFRSDTNVGNTVQSVTSEPGSRTWSFALRQQSPTQFWLEVWYLANAPAGDTTVTVTMGNPADQMRMVLTEYSGVATSDPIESTNSGSGTSATADAGGVVTSGVNRLIHVAAAADGNDDADTFTAGPGYTIHNLGPDPDGSDKTMTEHRIAATAGSYGTTMGNLNDSWACVAVVFLPGS